ncbi:serine/arginine-rich splicing factor 4-like [Venturia canescens]|uniref:serine/arginine-rich splicing factor 4-like n=1 Tax=Venturia canescens TaxID=32260 RepID=UPI001C9D2E6F|nr:serine/arginine-rich splicing factor 4-like [Venturia canescens]
MPTSHRSRRKFSPALDDDPDLSLDDVALVVAGRPIPTEEPGKGQRSQNFVSTQWNGNERSSGRSKLAGRKRCERRSEDNEHGGSSSPLCRNDIARRERDRGRGACTNPSRCRNRRKNSIPAVGREDSSVSGETTRAESTSTFSDRERKYDANKNQKTQTLEPPKDAKISSRNRNREVSVNSDTVGNLDAKRRSKELEKSRTKSVSNGNNAARGVKKKRTSRGVQVELKDDKKSAGSRGCCSFKCCSKNKKKEAKRKEGNSDEKQYGSESSDTYQPAVTKNEKNAKKREPEKRRISGGGERLTYPKLKNTDVPLLQSHVWRVNNPQRRSDRTRRSGQTTENQWIQKNEAADVKRRLNECLAELNGIIGDVGHLFRENVKNS